MAVFFISDLHLQPGRPELESAFYQFLDTHIQAGETLYVLGDFFDSWIGDDEDDPFYLGVKAKLRDVSSRATTFIMHGNRDFLIGEKFAVDTGMELLPDPHLIELHGENILLMHGDSLCTDDVEYMQFRQQVRGSAWQQHILSLPLEQRRMIAADLRAKSKSMTSLKAEDIVDVNQAEVEAVLKTHGVKTLIHGHTHRPNRHCFSLDGLNAERIVLGDWDKTGWYLKYENGFELVEFDI